MFHGLWRPWNPISKRRHCIAIAYRHLVITTSGFVASWSISSSSFYVFCICLTSPEPCEQNWVITFVKFEEARIHHVCSDPAIFPFSRPPSWIPRKRPGGFFRKWYRWKAHPRKHGGRHRNHVPIWSESVIEWCTAKFATLPPLFMLQNLVRSPRVNRHYSTTTGCFERLQWPLSNEVGYDGTDRP